MTEVLRFGSLLRPMGDDHFHALLHSKLAIESIKKQSEAGVKILDLSGVEPRQGWPCAYDIPIAEETSTLALLLECLVCCDKLEEIYLPRIFFACSARMSCRIRNLKYAPGPGEVRPESLERCRQDLPYLAAGTVDQGRIPRDFLERLDKAGLNQAPLKVLGVPCNLELVKYVLKSFPKLGALHLYGERILSLESSTDLVSLLTTSDTLKEVWLCADGHSLKQIKQNVQALVVANKKVVIGVSESIADVEEHFLTGDYVDKVSFVDAVRGIPCMKESCLYSDYFSCDNGYRSSSPLHYTKRGGSLVVSSLWRARGRPSDAPLSAGNSFRNSWPEEEDWAGVLWKRSAIRDKLFCEEATLRTKVAILDTGLDVAHPAFKSSLFDVGGLRSFVPNQSAWFDGTGHGTHCTGTIAGSGFGLADGDCSLFIGKVIDNDGSCDEAWVVEGLEWACSSGCKIVSLSCGFETHKPKLLAKINELVTAGVIIVCAAGNDGGLRPSSIQEPAAYGNCICVGSHDMHGSVSKFSAVGREVDVLAPGEKIFSCTPSFYADNDVMVAESCGRLYCDMSGTSMAAPFVTALLAKLLRYFSSRRVELDWSGFLARRLLQQMCSHPGAHDQTRGFGVVGPWKTVQLVGPANDKIEKILRNLLDYDDDSDT